MEGYGFLEAASRHRVPALVVRGISDLLDDKTVQADATRQPDAMRRAMGLAVDVLTRSSSRWVPPSRADSTSQMHGLRAPLTEVLTPPQSRDSTDGGGETRPRTNLPAPVPGPLIGRHSELALIHELLRPYPASQYAIVALDGVGGVGKTALALSAAYACLEASDAEVDDSNYFDAIVWVSAKESVLTAGGLRNTLHRFRTCADICSRLAEVLNSGELRTASPELQVEIAFRLLREQRVLLVLDNLETVEDPDVYQFVTECPAPTKLLLTSRRRVDGARSIRLDGLAQEEAKELVFQRAADFSVSITQSEADAIGRATSGLPLAIEWTVGQLRAGRPLDAALERLASCDGEYASFAFKESLQIATDAHGPTAQTVLEALTLFPAPATRGALLSVAALEGQPERFDDVMATLVDLSLVTYSVHGRYEMLPLTREYIVRLDEVADRLTRHSERWIQWYRALALSTRDGAADLDPGILRLLAEEDLNMMSAIDVAQRVQDFESWVAMIRGMEFFWFGTGRWTEFTRFLEAGRTHAPQPIDRIHFTARLAWLGVLSERFDYARVMLNSAQAQLGLFADAYEEMRLADFSGQLALAENRLDDAESLLTRAIELAGDAGDMRGLVACHRYIGEVYSRRGDVANAESHLRDAERYLGAMESGWTRAGAHLDYLRALVALARTDSHSAYQHLSSALQRLAEWPDRRVLEQTYSLLSDVAKQLGDQPASAEAHARSTELRVYLGMPERHYDI